MVRTISDDAVRRALAAGTIALTTGKFLSWTRLDVDTDLSGWVRQNAMLPFYRDVRSKPPESVESS